MNKKRNTILFILGATVFNLLIMLILLIAGTILVSYILKGRDPGIGGPLLLFLVFGLGIVGSYFIYNRTVRALSRKIDFDRYFEPLIKPRPRKNRD